VRSSPAAGVTRHDATLFAAWTIDYLKYDNCHAGSAPITDRYAAMRDALAATGRPIVFSLCVWGNKAWNWGPATGNSWRTTPDITWTWSSVVGIAKQNLPLAFAAGPGAWNDPTCSRWATPDSPTSRCAATSACGR
jgi:alpha-galactosidase